MDHNSCNHSSCTTTFANTSVHQTLSEMDWERGIWNAAFTGDSERIRLLIDKSKNSMECVNAPDNAGYTALHYAARAGHIDVCRLLLNHGAHIDALTRCGKVTPLQKAAAAGKMNIVKFLIQSGASITAQDNDGETALHKAINNKRQDVVNALLESCPELVNIKDAKGKCAISPT